MTYESHVREVAEEMAAERYWKEDYRVKSNLHWASIPLPKRMKCVDRELPYARIAVRREAEGVREMYIKHTYIRGTLLDQLLIDRGLIPAPGSCDGSGGCKDYGTIYVNEVVRCKLCRRPINSPSN